MDRSTTHSPRVDEAIAEANGTVARDVGVEPRADAPIPGALGEDERRRRSELAIALRPSAFPAQRDVLLRVAHEEQAPDWILDLLEALPTETRFDTVHDVWATLGGHEEVRELPETERVPPRPSVEQPGTPSHGGRGLLLTSLDVGVGVGVTAVHAAWAATRWAIRRSEHLLGRAA